MDPERNFPHNGGIYSPGARIWTPFVPKSVKSVGVLLKNKLFGPKVLECCSKTSFWGAAQAKSVGVLLKNQLFGTRHRSHGEPREPREPLEPPKWCQERWQGPHLPRTPGARMTVVTQTPSNESYTARYQGGSLSARGARLRPK